MSRTIRLLVFTNRPIIQNFFSTLGSGHRPPWRSARAAMTADALATTCEQLDQLDVAVVDLASDPAVAVQISQELRARRPDLPLAVLFCCSRPVTPQHLQSLVGIGIQSMLDLDVSEDQIVAAIEDLMRGEIVVHARFSGHHAAFLRDAVTGQVGLPGRASYRQLTEADYVLLNLVANGFTDAEIGHRLHLSRHTVNHHVERLRHAAQARNRTELAAWAAERGLWRHLPDDVPCEKIVSDMSRSVVLDRSFHQPRAG